MITSIPIHHDKVEELLTKLHEKDEEIKLLVQLCKERELLSDNPLSFINEVKSIRELASSLQHTLAKAELELTKTKHDSESSIYSLVQRMNSLESAYKKVEAEFSAINEARLYVIEEQKEAIDAYRKSSLKNRIKASLTPRIGVLYQYKPRRMHTPRRYKKKIELSNPPLISIVTPSFNQADYIERTISSVIAQEYPKLEYIIQDGGSTDDSAERISRYASKLKHWESKKDTGQSNAINLGMKHATGDIMAYLNSDDMLLAGSLHYVADYFSQHPEVDVVYGHRVLIDEYDQEVGRWVLPRHDDKVLTWADYVPQETLFWRKRIWEKAGGHIDENFRFAMDWDLLLRFINAEAKIVRLPRFLGAFRIHPHQKTSSEMTSLGMQEMERLRVRCHGRHVSDSEIKEHLRLYKIEHIILHKLYRTGILRY